jgi:hypothetical protein
LRRILSAFPQTEVTIWGPHFDALARHPRVRHLAPVQNYERFFSRFARARFDIGLAPLPDAAFYRCKSNNKFREYGACGVAGVYSDMPVYNTTVVDGVTGILARNDEDAWFSAIARLVSDERLRQRIARSAMAFARREWNEGVTDQHWIELIARTASAPRVPSGNRTEEHTRNHGRSSDGRRLIPSTAAAAQFVWTLSLKAPAALRRHGTRETGTRIRRYVAAFAQFLRWRVKHWRLSRGPLD